MTDIAALGLKVEGIQELERLLAAMDKLETQQDKVGGSTKVLATERKQLKTPTDQATAATKQLTEAERKFAEQAHKAGMSVGELKNALRGLPAQFTDIAVSLQGGQAPLTVFLQQGGQLKDMFGGAGVAARAMAGYITGLINPFSLAATAVIALGAAYYAGSREQDAFRISLATTGNAIGETTGSLAAYSKQIAESTSTQGKASESLNVFIQAGVRAESDLARFTETAIRWEKATGEGVDAVAEKFSALQKDPLSSALKLNDGMNFLTVSIYSQIKALEDQGDAAGASALAMSELDRAMAERSKNIEQNLGSIERGWNAVASAAKGAWDWMLNVGRQASLTERLATEQEKLVKLETEVVGLYEKGTHSRRLAEQRERVQLLMDEHAQSELNAAADKTRAEQVSALAGFHKQYANQLKEELPLAQQLAKARADGAAAGASEAEITQIVNKLTEDYNKKNKTRVTSTKAIENSYRTLAERAAEYVKSLELEAKQGEKISKSQQLEIELQSLIIRGKGKGTDAAVASTKALIAEAKAMETQAKARKAMAEAAEQYQKDLDDLAEYKKKESEAVAKQAQATYEAGKALENESRMLELQTGLIGASTQARELAIEQLRIQIELEKELDALDNNKDLTEKARDDAKAAARERAVQRGANAEKKILIDTYDEVNKYIEDGIYDAIVTGGASAGEALERMFKNLVLQPIVKAGVQSLLGSVGLGGGEGGSGNLLSTGKSVYDAFNSPMFSDFGSGIAGQIQQFGGTMFSKGFETFGSSVVDFGNTVAQYADTINLAGDVLGYGKAIFAATEGEWGNAIGTAVGTYFGGPIGSVIGSTIGSFVDGVFSGGNTPHSGAASQYAGGQITAGGKQFTRNAINADYIGEMQGTIDSLAFTLGSTLDGIDRLFGGSGGFSVTAGFKSDDDDPSNATLQISNAVGDTLVKWLAQRSGEFGSRATGQSYSSAPGEGFDDYLKAVTAATIPQFKEIVPAWADAMLDSFGQAIGFSGDGNDWKSITASGAESMQGLTAVLEQIAQIESAFDALGNSMSAFSGLTDEMRTALLGAFGSMENLTAAAGTYYNAFYSEQERYEASLKKVQDAMSAAGVWWVNPGQGNEGKDSFRRSLEGIKDLGYEDMYAHLLALAGPFSEMANYAQKAADEVAKAAEEAAQAAEDAALAASEAARAAMETAAQQQIQELSEAWGNFGTAAGLAAQYNGNTSGLSSQLGILRESYAGADDTSSRVAALQQIISLEQSLWQKESEQLRAKEVEQNAFEQARIDAIKHAAEAEINLERERIDAAREQLSSAKSLLNAAKSLGDYVDGLLISEAGGLSEAGRLSLSSIAYKNLYNSANRGNVDALSNVQGAASDYLDLRSVTASSSVEYAIAAGGVAAELDRLSSKQESVANNAIANAERQILASEKAVELAQKTADAAVFQSSFTEPSFAVSQSTQKLIDSLLQESAIAFEKEASDSQKLIDSGRMTVEALESLPAELAGAIGRSLIPAIQDIANTIYVPQGVDGSHATGLAVVPRDGYIAELHKGEAVVPAQYNPFNGGSMGMMGADVASLLMQIISDNRAQLGGLIKTILPVTRIVQRWDNDGLPEKREVNA